MNKIWVVADIKGSGVTTKKNIKFRGFTDYKKAQRFYERTTDFLGFGIMEVDMDENKPTENYTDMFKEI